jgi:predicted DNA binding CopG/RHH family protein
MKKRHVIPVDFTKAYFEAIKAEAAQRGLPTAVYIRMLVVTHPSRALMVKK